MIRHSALFRLHHAAGSPDETAFLDALSGLRAIPGVRDFALWREVSPKNPYTFAVSMSFADAGAYAAYDAHPDHRAFVESRWLPEVAEFMEHDTVAL